MVFTSLDLSVTSHYDRRFLWCYPFSAGGIVSVIAHGCLFPNPYLSFIHFIFLSRSRLYYICSWNYIVK